MQLLDWIYKSVVIFSWPFKGNPSLISQSVQSMWFYFCTCTFGVRAIPFFVWSQDLLLWWCVEKFCSFFPKKLPVRCIVCVVCFVNKKHCKFISVDDLIILQFVPCKQDLACISYKLYPTWADWVYRKVWLVESGAASEQVYCVCPQKTGRKWPLKLQIQTSSLRTWADVLAIQLWFLSGSVGLKLLNEGLPIVRDTSCKRILEIV